MNSKILNITNGDFFNEYLKNKFSYIAIPFCEAMMDGKIIGKIYSNEFISCRAKSLNVSEKEYRDKMFVYDYLTNKEYQSICLWFGKDTFCQMNLLTLLAYLEQIEFKGKLKLNYIADETFEILESNIDVKLGVYNRAYEDILLLRKIPNDIGVLNAKAIELFFDYYSKNGAIVKLIKANSHMNKNDLVRFLLEQSKDYGLSDLQAERLINSYCLENYKK